LSLDDIKKFRSLVAGHDHQNLANTTGRNNNGPLGQGVAVAVGMAMGGGIYTATGGCRTVRLITAGDLL